MSSRFVMPDLTTLPSLHVLSPLRAYFFFSDTAPPEIYTLSLHDALPISRLDAYYSALAAIDGPATAAAISRRSEEHTSELQSHVNLVCRLLLEKKKDDVHVQHDHVAVVVDWQVDAELLDLCVALHCRAVR